MHNGFSYHEERRDNPKVAQPATLKRGCIAEISPCSRVSCLALFCAFCQTRWPCQCYSRAKFQILFFIFCSFDLNIEVEALAFCGASETNVHFTCPQTSISVIVLLVVQVVRGTFKSRDGKVTTVYRRKFLIHVERITREKNNGTKTSQFYVDG